MPELKDGARIFLDTIDKKLRHPDYERVMQLAKTYTMYATGEGFKEQLIRMHGRESEDELKQREILTIVNTADIHNSCNKPLYKALRTPATSSLTWQGKDASQTAEYTNIINQYANDFWGGKSVDDYLRKRQPDFDKTDCNAWLIIEFKERATPQNKIKPKPYPFEANSEEAINFEFRDNVLQYIIVRNDAVMVDENKKPVPGEVLYCYLENHNITARQIHPKTVEQFKRDNPNHEIIAHEVGDTTKLTFDLSQLKEDVFYIYTTTQEGNNTRFYILNVFETNFGFVPAKRFGTKTDPITRDRTCVPISHPAECYLKDSIQTLSEFSITKACHTFPQKFVYLPKCKGTETVSCYKGQTPDGGTCQVCKGSGTIAHTSGQDIVGIEMPDEIKDIVNLEYIMTYKGPPMDLVKFQKEFGFEDLKRYAIAAIYNDASNPKTKVVKTATENEIDLEAMYDALKPFADHHSEMRNFVYKAIAVLQNIDEGFEAKHQFPNDFGMEPLDYLLTTLTQANTSGAPSHVKKSLTRKINNKIYADQPREITKFETKDKFFPFPGKSESEINFMLADPGQTTRYNKVFFNHFDLVFSELEYEFGLKNIDFYQLAEPIQRAAIQKKVRSIITAIDKEDAESASQPFGGTGEGDKMDTPIDIEAEAKAQLKGSVGGVQGILEIKNSVAQGISDYESAVVLLFEIYGFNDETARAILGNVKPQPQTLKPAIPVLN